MAVWGPAAQGDAMCSGAGPAGAGPAHGRVVPIQEPAANAHRLTRQLLLIGACMVVVSCGGTPTAPSGSQVPAPVLPAPAPPAPVTPTGRVVSAIDTSIGLSDVAISGSGLPESRSNVEGAFTLQTPASTYTILLQRVGFVERQTAVSLPATGLRLSMIPNTFDIAAFEEFSPRASGLKRWTSDPSLVVLTSAVDWDNGTLTPRVTDHVLSSGDFDCVLSGVRDAIGPMSGGALAFKSVTAVSPPFNSRYALAGTPEGTVVVMVARGLDANGRAGPLQLGSSATTLTRGAIWINGDVLPLCSPTATGVYPHELGHALGYLHITRQPSIMSSLGPTRTPTQFDKDAMAVIYQRPPGNRAPDIDPAGFVVAP